MLGIGLEDISKIPANLLGQMAAEYPFVVIGSSEKYIENFKSGDTNEISFKLRINNDAKTKGYEMPMKIKYFDPAGIPHEISKTVGVEVKGQPGIELRIKESEITGSKGSGKITIEILNKGSADAQFFKIKILSSDKYSVISGDEEYIGSLESDDSENVDFNIKVPNPQKVNNVPISLSIEYKDNYNEEYKENFNVNLKVLSDDDLVNGGSGLMTVVIILIILVLVYLVYKKLRQ
ncbi:MAG: hypothetical protein CVT90_02195 [Candidatus Altiarchaeales archaeon HGW-Altiarchaeales-3]|nr:MAG: hypothetical protein CVT90_02195 [Candidatus Altiarchaeales archaeon HGW-Altiarchaeales-3]